MEQNQEQVFRVHVPGKGEILGIVEGKLPNNKLKVRCQDNKIRVCRIVGKLKKRVWMDEGDIVLITPWSIQGDTNADVIIKYRPSEIDWLRKKGILKL